jgi:hypothetical protein
MFSFRTPSPSRWSVAEVEQVFVHMDRDGSGRVFLIAEYDASAEVQAAGRAASPDDGQHGHVTVAVNNRQLSKSSQTRLGR